MNIGPKLYSQIDRIQPVERDADEQDPRERRRHRVLYQGRQWEEGDEELPVQPQPHEQKRREGEGEHHLDRAQQRLGRLFTIEERVAKLLFCATEATYDPAVQAEIEHAIAVFQIGGLLFTRGDFRRQQYLVSCYQNLSSTPLLIGNDFLHGLSFYFEGNQPLSSIHQKMTEQRYLDLGKAVMAQNRALGVHFQLDRERVAEGKPPQVPISEDQVRAFRRGVREAQGIIARPFTPSPRSEDMFAIKTLNLIDLTEGENIEARLLEAASQPFDGILIAGGISRAIELLAAAVRSGRISEESVCRKLLKLSYFR